MTTGDGGRNGAGIVSGIPITTTSEQSRPIAIKARRDAAGNFMDRNVWFSGAPRRTIP